ncbi:MAG: hypothetical protein JXA14_08140 [Anaerolineae bacterium]|nr:hypothetical protein [Anaerolineae bacterium]
MTSEMIILLAGLGVAALAILALRLGKRLVTLLLIAGVLGVVGMVALTLVEQARAARQAAQAATVAAAGQTMTSVFVAFLMGAVFVVVVGVVAACGYFWLRWRLLQRQLERLRRPSVPQYRMMEGWLPQGERREAPPETTPAIYYVDAGGDEVELPPEAMAYWGW